MLVRLFIAAVALLILALAAAELKVLWPLVGDASEEFELTQLGQTDLSAQKELRLDGLAVTPSGNVWVADVGSPPRLIALDSAGQRLDEVPGTTAPGISADGESVLTVEPKANAVLQITRGAGVTQTWDLKNYGLFVPTGAIRVRPDAVAITSTGSGTVFLFEPGGDPIGTLGLRPDGRPLLLEPRYPAVDSEGRLYVTDRKGRIVRFDGDRIGTTYRTRDREAATLSDPQQIAIDGKGRVWVADEVAGRVWVFDSSGKFLGDWQPDVAPRPVGLAIGGDRIYITSRDNPLLYWFQLPA